MKQQVDQPDGNNYTDCRPNLIQGLDGAVEILYIYHSGDVAKNKYNPMYNPTFFLPLIGLAANTAVVLRSIIAKQHPSDRYFPAAGAPSLHGILPSNNYRFLYFI